jgi:hypothetical protein
VKIVCQSFSVKLNLCIIWIAILNRVLELFFCGVELLIQSCIELLEQIRKSTYVVYLVTLWTFEHSFQLLGIGWRRRLFEHLCYTCRHLTQNHITLLIDLLKHLYNCLAHEDVLRPAVLYPQSDQS